MHRLTFFSPLALFGLVVVGCASANGGDEADTSATESSAVTSDSLGAGVGSGASTTTALGSTADASPATGTSTAVSGTTATGPAADTGTASATNSVTATTSSGTTTSSTTSAVAEPSGTTTSSTTSAVTEPSGTTTSSTTSAATDADTSSSSEPTTTSPTDVEPLAATFADVVYMISEACSACHMDKQSLSFQNDRDQLYDKLLNTPIAQCGNAPLIVPGDAQGSALLMTMRHECGELVMPEGWADNPTVGQEWMDMFVSWVSAGAVK